MLRIILAFAFVTASLILYSCNAPHENPADPDNPDYSLYYIEGTVYSSEAVSQPIKNVIVSWPSENKSVLTDDKGYFKINCDNIQNGYICFERSGCNGDSIFVNWGSKKTISVSQRLNFIPVLDSIFIYTSIKNKYSQPENQLIVEAYVSDKDNDIDSVSFLCSSLQLTKSLGKLSSHFFEGKFNDYDLNVSSLEEFIGKKIDVTVYSGGKSFLVGNANITRVISSEISTISPKNSDTISTNYPTLTWTRFEPGFDFHYMIEIYTDEPEPKLLWSKDNISSDDIYIDCDGKISVTADNDRFFWVIWCIDEYQNRSRSKPAGFVIKAK
jgi:hypothetical protein